MFVMSHTARTIAVLTTLASVLSINCQSPEPQPTSSPDEVVTSTPEPAPEPPVAETPPAAETTPAAETSAEPRPKFDASANKQKLMAKLEAGSATESELRQLKALCMLDGDAPCRNKAAAAMKALEK
jgi:hypothetical protein